VECCCWKCIDACARIVGTSFPSGCSVVVGNVFVLMIERKLACVIFPSLCNFVVGNVVDLVLERKFSFTFIVQCCCWQYVRRNVVVSMKGKLEGFSFMVHYCCWQCAYAYAKRKASRC
jgi:hypothetical protein